MIINSHKSSVGLEANVWAMLIYLITLILSWVPFVKYAIWLFPLIVYFAEKQSSFVKFHAMQAVAAFSVNAVVALCMKIIGSIVLLSFSAFRMPIITTMISSIFIVITAIVSLLITIFVIIALIRAYNYEEYNIPLLGKLAERFHASASR